MHTNEISLGPRALLRLGAVPCLKHFPGKGGKSASETQKALRHTPKGFFLYSSDFLAVVTR